MNYDFEKTKSEHYQEIFKKKLEDGSEYGLISHDENFIDYIENREDISNWFVMDSSLNSERIAELFEFLTQIYLSSKLEVNSKNGNILTAAEGRDLDSIGKLLFCSRPEATKAGAELTFTLSRELDSDVSESAGIQVSTRSGVVFETAEELYFAAGNTQCTVQAYAVTPGTGGRVVANSLTRILTRFENINVTVSVTNLASAAGGSDAYGDDEYRELIKHWIEVHLKGHHYAYINYFARVDGVEGYKLIPNWDGSGTIKIVVDPGDAYTLNKIYDEINKGVTQESEAIVLMAPVLKTVDVYAVCNVDIDTLNPYSNNEKSDIASKITSGIRVYIENMKLGEDFIPHKLGVYLDKEIPELKNIEFSYPEDPVTIDSEEKCVAGDIEIIME
ncbi:MAG: baseplate J/gp47 family protein [Methanobrevibacter sp.]|nr:baseplate J/gp47 family protein [Methanobrevibacter sp.]